MDNHHASFRAAPPRARHGSCEDLALIRHWLARSLRASYVATPDDEVPRELLDLLPDD